MTDTTGVAARERWMDPKQYATWCRIAVRYNDLDPLGHVNNTAMAIFLEEARCSLIAPRLKAHGRHIDMVLASTTMDYRREITYPGEVEVGLRATRIGSKSFGLAHGIFQAGQCVGTAELAMVVFDLDKRRAVDIPDDVRAFLAALLAT